MIARLHVGAMRATLNDRMDFMFLDESGFTGEQLLDPDQPVLVLATIFRAESECAALKRQVFADVRATELKHAALSRRAKHQAMVGELVRQLAADPSRVKFSIAHKKYALVTFMVDWLVEIPMHEDGVDLYHQGANLSLANLLFYALPTLGGAAFFEDLLHRFQAMMRLRTYETYEAFFRPLFRDTKMEQLEDALTYVRAFHVHPRCGFERLRELPPKALSLPFTCAMALMGRWRSDLTEPFVLIHDSSSEMVREREMWDALVDPSVAPALVGYDRRTVQFPLLVAETRFDDSRNWCGLQVADVIAGALAYRFRWLIDGSNAADQYGAALWSLPWDDFGVHALWPEPHVAPEELGTVGPNAADPMDHFAKVLHGAGVQLGRLRSVRK